MSQAAPKSLPVVASPPGGAPGRALAPRAAEGREPWWIIGARVVAALLFVAAVPVVMGLPVGMRLFWTVTIACLPLLFVLAGFHFWRRICPLALVGQAGRFLGIQRDRKVGPWLAENYLYVQFGVLFVGLAARLVATNGTPWALAAFLGAIAAAAFATSILYTGKTWCNFLCPVGIVEKFYTEPTQLRRGDNSQCATCTACKKNCPDIDLEHGYWKEAGNAARRVTYFAWPGVVLAFYGYFHLCSGGWAYYFTGAWTREPEQVRLALEPGLSFAPWVPRLVAAPLSLAAGGVLSFALFALGERLALGRAGAGGPAAEARVRHRALALAGTAGFLLFYVFAGQPTLAEAPWWLKRGVEMLVVGAAVAMLLGRWNRQEQHYVQEKFARGILRRWEWGDEPPSDDLGDIYLIHTERTRQRELRVRAYKETVRELIADGVVSRGELALLDKLRAQLGITDKDHEKVLSELSAEEKRLFDPAYRGSIEERLQEEQYRRDLERLVLYAAREGRAPEAAALERLRQEHNVSPETHARVLRTVQGEGGPLAATVRETLGDVARLRRAARRALDAEGASSASVAFFRRLAAWRERQLVDVALSCLAMLREGRGLEEAREGLSDRDPAARDAARSAVRAALAGDPLGAELVAFLDDEARAVAPPPDAGADAAALVQVARDVSPYLRAAAAWVLSRFGDDAERRAVVAATRDDHPLVRETAVRVLGARGRLTRELVARAMADPDPRVGRAVIRAVAPEEAAGAVDPVALAQTTTGLGTANPARVATLDHRAAVESLCTLEKMMLLAGVPLFGALEPGDLDELSAIATERRWPAGAELCREGDASDEVFVIVSGRVRAWVKGPDGAAQVLGESSDESCIGEMAALDRAPRAATVTAVSDTRALVLAGREFKHLIAGRPAIAEGVLGVLTARLRDMIAQKQRSA